MRASEDGVTLVEILVVILIIGILAAIALPSFTSQRERARDAATKEDVRVARVAIEAFHTSEETYDATVAELVALEPKLASARNLTVDGDRTTFTVSADSASGDNGGTFSMAKDEDGRVTRTCTNRGFGGCRAAADADGNYW